MWSLRRLLKLNTFDVVHVHDEALACLLSFLIPRRYYYTSHTSIWALKRAQGEMLSLSEQLDAITESFAIRNSRGTVALSDYLAPRIPHAPVETIAHGIDPDRWQPMGQAASREALGIHPDDFVAVFVGRMHPQKGLDILVQAVQAVARERRRLQLFVIGSAGGHYCPKERPSAYSIELLRMTVGTPVRFVGFLEHNSQHLRRYLSAADVAIVPSRHEPFGYVALEALAMSLPVIASRTGGLAQTVTDDVGMLVEPGDVSALADAIRSVYDDPAKIAAWRENCRARVESKYTRRESVARHLALFMKEAREPALHLEISR